MHEISLDSLRKFETRHEVRRSEMDVDGFKKIKNSLHWTPFAVSDFNSIQPQEFLRNEQRLGKQRLEKKSKQ